MSMRSSMRHKHATSHIEQPALHASEGIAGKPPTVQICGSRVALSGRQQQDKPRFDTEDEVRPTGRWEPTCADAGPQRPTSGDRRRLPPLAHIIDNTFG